MESNELESVSSPIPLGFLCATWMFPQAYVALGAAGVRSHGWKVELSPIHQRGRLEQLGGMRSELRFWVLNEVLTILRACPLRGNNIAIYSSQDDTMISATTSYSFRICALLLSSCTFLPICNSRPIEPLASPSVATPSSPSPRYSTLKPPTG